MTTATALRMVLLCKVVGAAQSSVYVRLTQAFEGWHTAGVNRSRHSSWTSTWMCLMASCIRDGGSGHFIRCGGDGPCFSTAA